MDRHHRKYNTNTGVENFILRLKENNPDIEYYSDYINSESKVKLKCNKCGNIFERYASAVRKNNKIRCFECEKKDTQKRKQIKEYNKYIKKEIKKAINSKQLMLSICKQCGYLFIGNTLYCSKNCRDKGHTNRKDRLRYERAKQNGKIDYTITLDKLIKRDNNICYICNRECNLNDYIYNENTFIAGNYYPSIDHVIPIAKGGTHEWDNIRLAHRICNSLKGDKV